MEYFQKSDINNRAKKAYQTQTHGCEIIIRELMSNAYHALLIKPPENPEISISIDPAERSITISDNGCGFTSEDRKTMDILDKENNSKKSRNLPSKGEGRLAFVYFAGGVQYETVSEESGSKQLFSFSFPPPKEDDLFQNIKGKETENSTGTKATVRLPSGRAWDTFFNKMIKPDKNTFHEFLEKEFFYFFIGLEKLVIKFHILSSEKKCEKTGSITHQEVPKIQFKVEPLLKNNPLFEENISPIDIKAYIHEYSKNTSMEILVVAHDVTVKVKASEKLVYDCLFPNKGIRIYIASDFFSDKVVNSGLELNLNEQIVKDINNQLKESLNDHFATDIKTQYQKNNQTFQATKKNCKHLILFSNLKIIYMGLKNKQKTIFKHLFLRILRSNNRLLIQ